MVCSVKVFEMRDYSTITSGSSFSCLLSLLTTDISFTDFDTSFTISWLLWSADYETDLGAILNDLSISIISFSSESSESCLSIMPPVPPPWSKRGGICSFCLARCWAIILFFFLSIFASLLYSLIACNLFFSAALSCLYILNILKSRISLIMRIIRVTRLALVVFAMSVVRFVFSKIVPCCVMAYQIQPQSGIMVIVDTISSQKKKLLKYPSIETQASKISRQKKMKLTRVSPKNTLSEDLGHAIIRMSSKNRE